MITARRQFRRLVLANASAISEARLEHLPLFRRLSRWRASDTALALGRTKSAHNRTVANDPAGTGTVNFQLRRHTASEQVPEAWKADSPHFEDLV